jgi:hypothetical protein
MPDDAVRYPRYRFPPAIISHAVWLYYLSFAKTGSVFILPSPPAEDSVGGMKVESSASPPRDCHANSGVCASMTEGRRTGGASLTGADVQKEMSRTLALRTVHSGDGDHRLQGSRRLARWMFQRPVGDPACLSRARCVRLR